MQVDKMAYGVNRSSSAFFRVSVDDGAANIDGLDANTTMSGARSLPGLPLSVRSGCGSGHERCGQMSSKPSAICAQESRSVSHRRPSR